MVPEKDRIELGGFIYEAHTEYEVIRVRQANLLPQTGLSSRRQSARYHLTVRGSRGRSPSPV